MKVNTQVQRPQLQSFAPPTQDDPPGYSYQERLENTPGDTLDEIRGAGFEDLSGLGRRKALAGTGSAVTRGVAFGLGLATVIRLINGSAGAVTTGCIAAGAYLGHLALENLEERTGQSIESQVHFLRDLDEAQLQLTGIPADPWIFV